MKTPAFEIQVNRKKFHEYQLVEKKMPSDHDLKDGQILIKVDQFAFTANNITYAVVGDLLGYWNFFPVSKDWGIIPVWGFGDVIASKNEEIKLGSRYYGYYPMGSHLILSPTHIKTNYFTDGIEHRAALPPVYNNYINTQSDPAYKREGEAIQSLFRPLFTTAFLIDDFLEDHDFFGGKNMLLTSASSKTAIGLAFLLSQRKEKTDINIIGLTSGKNEEFVKGLGYYDTVFTYDQINQLDKKKTVMVDFSGNGTLLQSLNNHLSEHLVYTCLVGLADWTHRNNVEGTTSKGQFFFAPSQFTKRSKEWGGAVLQQKLGAAWLSFTSQVGDWMTVQITNGPGGLVELYLPMLEGNIDPKIGHIIT